MICALRLELDLPGEAEAEADEGRVRSDTLPLPHPIPPPLPPPADPPAPPAGGAVPPRASVWEGVGLSVRGAPIELGAREAAAALGPPEGAAADGAAAAAGGVQPSAPSSEPSSALE